MKSFLPCGIAKESTPEDVSCLKEGKPGHGAFTKVKKYWDSGVECRELSEADEDQNNEVVIYDE